MHLYGCMHMRLENRDLYDWKNANLIIGKRKSRKTIRNAIFIIGKRKTIRNVIFIIRKRKTIRNAMFIIGKKV